MSVLLALGRPFVLAASVSACNESYTDSNEHVLNGGRLSVRKKVLNSNRIDDAGVQIVSERALSH